MSTWRDIWKKSIKANRLYSLDENEGTEYLATLSRKYENEKRVATKVHDLILQKKWNMKMKKKME